MSEPRVLIVEDGDEYLENLSKFVPGPRYTQAHNGRDAVAILAARRIDLIYLDMRFDRIPEGDLMGDHAAATKEHNGDPVRAWRFLQTNQGLYILEAIRNGGHAHIPVILAYDFTRQKKRYEHLARIHPSLHWVPDDVSPGEIRSLMNGLIAEP